MLLNAQQLALEILSNMCCPDGKGFHTSIDSLHCLDRVEILAAASMTTLSIIDGNVYRIILYKH